MLKIKDNVDYKELESKGLNSRPISGAMRIDEYNREITMYGSHYGDVEEKALDFLYDLIQAGLVEKV